MRTYDPETKSLEEQLGIYQSALLKVRLALGLGRDSQDDLIEVIQAGRKARELAEFSWAGCSQQLKDAISDLEETEQALAESKEQHAQWETWETWCREEREMVKHLKMAIQTEKGKLK